MITIVINADRTIEVYSDKSINEHMVIVNTKERWTDSPEWWTILSESEQAEYLADAHNDGFEDRNP